ncbi:MAG: M48 family metallopeptidase [Peptococcaceae bacterium]|nr:M48 family metallopeptidase [Peptococcaceae bacterium]
MEKLIINDIEIEISKKKIKNLYLSIKASDGRVCVSAPLAMSEERIELFVKSKSIWIAKKLDRIRKQPAPVECSYLSGDCIPFWGKEYNLELVYSHKNMVQVDGNKIILQARETSTARHRENIINSWYRTQMRAEIDILSKACQDKVGVSAAEWGIKTMKTRWGTCNISKRKIWLNLLLVKKSVDCLEYVIIHELVHLLERNHTKRFYSFLDKFIPHWRKIKSTLNNLT